MVFLETFWLQGEWLGDLSFQSIQFGVAFGFLGDSMKIFISLHPEFDGVVNGDHDDPISPSVFTSGIVCFQEKQVFSFLGKMTGEEVCPSQLSLMQNSLAV